MESRLAMPDADVPASVDAAVGREGKLVLVLAEREGDPNRGVGLTDGLTEGESCDVETYQ